MKLEQRNVDNSNCRLVKIQKTQFQAKLDDYFASSSDRMKIRAQAKWRRLCEDQESIAY